MNTTLKKIAGVVAGIMLFVACTPSNDGPYIIPITYQSADLIMGYGGAADQTLTITTAPQLVLSRNFSDETLQFTLNSLYASGGMISGTSPELKYKTTSYDQNGKLIISLPTVNFGNYTFTDFNFIGFGNWMTMQFNYNGTFYVINSAYTYTDMDINVRFVLWDAETLVTGTPFDPSGFETDKTRYAFSLNSTSQAGSIIIYDAQFASSMPELQILIPGVKFAMTPTGYKVWSDGDIEPQQITLGGTVPQPGYVIKNLNAFLPYNTAGGEMQFNCSENDWLVQANDMEITVLTSEDQF